MEGERGADKEEGEVEREEEEEEEDPREGEVMGGGMEDEECLWSSSCISSLKRWENETDLERWKIGLSSDGVASF